MDYELAPAPVEGNPFESAGYELAPTPVEGDPFKKRPDLSPIDVVRGNPFAMSPGEMAFPGDVPEAFLDRVRRGQALKRIVDKAASKGAEGFGDEPIGLSPEHAIQLHDTLFKDSTPINMLGEGAVHAVAGGLDAIMRGVEAGIHGAGGAWGQINEELGASQSTAQRAQNEVINAGNWAMIEGGMGGFTRPNVGWQAFRGLTERPARPIPFEDQAVGGLPKPEDFKTAAAAIAESHHDPAVIEQNLQTQWRERGVHPAEAAHDASRDAFLKQELATPEPAPAPAPREAPIVAFRREAAEIEGLLPKPAEGLVRLWRGNRPGEEGQNPSFTNGLPGIALPFRKAYGGKLTYVDIPENELGRYTQDIGSAHGAEFILPKELASTAKAAERTKAAHIDAVLSHPDVADAIAAPKVNRTQDVPYTAGPDNTGNGLNIDKHFPESFAVDQDGNVRATGAAPAETIRGAAYTVGGKTYEAPVHVLAMDKAVEDLKVGTYSDLIDLQAGDDLTQKLAAHRSAGNGFVTSTGRVVSRDEARVIAEAAEQGKATAERGIKAEDMRMVGAPAKTFDPAQPFAVHEFTERHAMNTLIAGGMDEATAYKVAHHEVAEPAEGRWYDINKINKAKAEAAYQPFIEKIEHEKLAKGDGDVPADLFRKPYPHDSVDAAAGEKAPVPKPTAEEIARGREILAKGEGAEAPGAVGADVTRPENLPSLDEQKPPRAGSIAASITEARDRLLDMGHDLQMLTAPMAAGSQGAMAIAKDFANRLRRNRWEWSRIDKDVADRFNPEQRKRMWDAADEESVARQLGESREHQGLVTLEPAERAAVEDLQTRAQNAFLRAKDLGMVEGEGLPSYTPRMLINIANSSSGDKALALDVMGRNLRVRTGQLLRRQYMTAEETEAAAKKKFGDEAEIARDIRALPLATAKLEDAIAGRSLINSIEEYGKRTGDATVVEGTKPVGWFTLDHPAFRKWAPKFETDPETGAVKAALDDKGNAIFQQVPIYVRGDFEGPLRAVLTQNSGAMYQALMALKGKTMSLIMNSPLIHNAVEWGRALPSMPGKVATFKVYFEGNRAKNDPTQMREAIDNGLVPIGHRFFNQDITSIMEEPNLAPGRSWTAQILGAVPGLFDEAAGDAVKAAIDKAGDFWHNTLLWDRVGDLQMGLYANFRDDLLTKGVDRQTAARAAAHWANRYAGALPQEAMSDAARKTANLLLFSRSFTLGNVGALKDMFTGLPRDVMAQIGRDVGALDPEAKGYIKSLAMRKAISVVALDMGLMYVGNSLLQNAMNVLYNDSTLDKEMHGYAERLGAELTKLREHPLSLMQALSVLGSPSATSENEPTKQDRIRVGYASDGTAIYARNPVGKIGEEFVGYMTGPLDMLRRKLGTIARPAWQILANDKGFGRKVYDPNADTVDKYLKNIGLIVTHLVKSQFPEGQINAFADLVKGEGDAKVNALGAFGPVAGVTFSKGAPGGPAVGELYQARTEHQYAVDAALPDIRKQIQRGDIQGARDRLTELGVPGPLQGFYIRTSVNPATRLSAKTLRDFYTYATPEQRARFEAVR